MIFMMELAPRVRLYPSGSARPALDPGWLALAQHAQDGAAGVVFGDGSHPTTRLCAAVLDQLCRQRQPEAVLDVGTGTGVLARIARARGATFVVGTDIDAEALQSAAANSALDAQGIVVSGREPDYWGARFDVVVANILEEPLRTLAPALQRALAENGVLAISGFMRAQVPAIRVCFERNGMQLAGEAYLDEWALLLLRSPQSRACQDGPPGR
jgi:ribosomal protein L11 methyltransferase